MSEIFTCPTHKQPLDGEDGLCPRCVWYEVSRILDLPIGEDAAFQEWWDDQVERTIDAAEEHVLAVALQADPYSILYEFRRDQGTLVADPIFSSDPLEVAHAAFRALRENARTTPGAAASRLIGHAIDLISQQRRDRKTVFHRICECGQCVGIKIDRWCGELATETHSLCDPCLARKKQELEAMDSVRAAS